MTLRLTLALWALSAISASAQTDVSRYYLANPGFDAGFDYTAESTATVTQEIKTIDGWTPQLSANYTVTGVYQ